jgi:hypothetical protein
MACDAATQAAVAALTRILATPTPWTLRGRLEPGMGLACNNVLHDRSGFAETPEHRRLLYRARYHERICTDAELTGSQPRARGDAHRVCPGAHRLLTLLNSQSFPDW